MIESHKGAMDKFFRSNTCTSRNSDELAIVTVEEQTNVNLEDQGPTEDNIDINTDDNNVSNHEHIFNSSTMKSASLDEQPVFITNIYDPIN